MEVGRGEMRKDVCIGVEVETGVRYSHADRGGRKAEHEEPKRR